MPPKAAAVLGRSAVIPDIPCDAAWLHGRSPDGHAADCSGLPLTTINNNLAYAYYPPHRLHPGAWPPFGMPSVHKGGGGSGSSTGAITRSNPAHSPHQKMKLLQDFASSSSIGTGSPVNPAWGNRRQKIPPRFMLASFMNLPCYTGSSKLALSEAELHHWLKRHRQKDPGSRSGYRIGDIRTDGYLEVLSAGQPEIDVRHAAVRQQAGASGVFSFRNTSGGNAPSTDASLLSNSTSHRNATKEKTWLSDLIIGLSPEQVMMVVIYHSTRIQ